jgi:Secretion system C-terminal sorting domain
MRNKRQIIMTKQLLLTLILSAYMALSINAQYFSRTYFNDSEIGSDGYQICKSEIGQMFISHRSNCEGHWYCDGFSLLNANGILQNTNYLINKDIFFYSTKSRNDTLFYAARDRDILDGNKYHWYFGMLDELALPLNEFKFEMPITQNEIPLIYGTELLKNGEIILWGEGLHPNGSQEMREIYLVWIRVKLDGTIVSGPHYFKPDYREWSNVTNATTDIDGNMVFIYEVTDRLTGLWKEVYKIHENDSITKIIKVDVESFQDDFPRLAIDHDGNYIFQDIQDRNGNYPNFLKIGRDGDVVWKETFEQMFSPLLGFEKVPNVSNFKVNSIKVATNNDILVCGFIAIMDSIYIPNLKKKVIVSGRNGSFMARYSPDGELRWRHFLLSANDNGKARNVGIRDITEMPDGSLVVAGFLGRKDTTLVGIRDAWVMKVGPNGCFDPECSNVPDNRWWYFPEEIPTSAIDLVTYEKLSLYPNPGIDKIHISLPDGIAYPIQYQITTMTGQTVEKGVQQEQNFSLDASYLSGGTYIILSKDKSGKVWYGKWVKM